MEALKSSASHQEHCMSTPKELKNPCSPTVLWLLRAPYTGTLTYPAARGPSPQLLGISFKIQDEISLVEGRDLFLSPAFYIFLSTPFSLPGPHAWVELFLVIHKATLLLSFENVFITLTIPWYLTVVRQHFESNSDEVLKAWSVTLTSIACHPVMYPTLWQMDTVIPEQLCVLIPYITALSHIITNTRDHFCHLIIELSMCSVGVPRLFGQTPHLSWQYHWPDKAHVGPWVPIHIFPFVAILRLFFSPNEQWGCWVTACWFLSV